MRPNPYYGDVTIDRSRLLALPEVRAVLPGLRVIDTDDLDEEEDRGPAEGQHQPDPGAAAAAAAAAAATDANGFRMDETVTTSGFTSPRSPIGLDAQMREALAKVVGGDLAAKLRAYEVMQVNYEHA